MERTTFLDHYRIRANREGIPHEFSQTSAVITYKAVDERSGETVALKLIPIESIDSAAREQFEQGARAAERIHHINIAKVFAFGRGRLFRLYLRVPSGRASGLMDRGARSDASRRCITRGGANGQRSCYRQFSQAHALRYSAIQPDDCPRIDSRGALAFREVNELRLGWAEDPV